ncbi:cell division protein FtsQ/DivIB [Coprobacter tertius]|uniref:Cell division protein FtsQ/DivIB n=1 Tax=Coprobacter tertius TaxID=2944915 RepID=A0ABT1MDM6_9BACT|nr:cell division protein FtsQ/DivIB [Coprobacter tertius]MCP9610743.1 cell division protein FtsQ/DivIB [Coprobacter tertius]
MKKIFKYLLICILPAYLIAALIYYAPAEGNVKCKRIEVHLADSTETHFTSVNEIKKEITEKGIDPVGKLYSEINTEKMEQVLKKNQLIATAECYKTPSGTIKIDISQRVPVIRIIANGETYYIDSNGKIMPTTQNFTAYLPLATGFISRDYAKDKLYSLALFLKNNEFWNSQIEQIYVTPDKEIEIIPRIGDNLILMGKIDNFERKLENLRYLYDQALPKVGWNKYDTISLKYENQVICTRRDKNN